jgi:hypothetical protein
MGRVQKYVCSARPSARCYWLLAEVANSVDLKRALGAVVMDVQELLLASGNTVGPVCNNNLGH